MWSSEMVARMLSIALALVSMAGAGAIQYPQEWHLWKSEHGVTYTDELEELRRHITWLSNKAYIDRHNEYSDTFGYTLKMNHLGDMTSREFVESYMCVGQHSNTRMNASDMITAKNAHLFQEYRPVQDSSGLPEEIDWRTSGAVSNIEDQLRCSCSYAFAAVGALEGAISLSGGGLVSLSSQNIVDCSVPYGNHGCSCGDINSAYLYIIDNEGVDTLYNYPYKSRQLSCRYSSKHRGGSMSGVITIGSGNERALQSAVANVGPVSTYVDASHSSFQFYSDGILDIPNCSRSKLTHAMVIIGYGTAHNKDYWLLKNRYNILSYNR